MFPRTTHNAMDESRRLQQVLRLAVDEAQLTAVPMRWWARTSSYGFEKLVNQQWQAVSDGVFASHKLDGVVIDQVLENGVDQQPEDDLLKPSQQDFFDRRKKSTEPLVGRVVILPNGMVTVVDIVLMNVQGERLPHRLQIRPGPTGIIEEDRPT